MSFGLSCILEMPGDEKLSKKQLYAKRYVARLKTDMHRYLRRREANRIRQAKCRCRKRGGVWDSRALCETRASKVARQMLNKLQKSGELLPDVSLIETIMFEQEKQYQKMSKADLIVELRSKEATIREMVSVNTACFQ